MLKKILLFMAIFSTLFATPKDTIIIAVENEPSRVNPLFMDDHDASIGLIFSALVRFDENMQIKPDLAKSWKISQNGLVYEFFLRENVLWHDGEKFSAKDAKFTLEALLNEKLNSPIKANFAMIKSVEILSDTHLKITLKEPYGAFLSVLSVGILPEHLLKNENLNTSKFNQAPIGTGAFKFKAWKKGAFMRLQANENFHLGEVKTKNLILKFINDPSLAAIELKNKSVDVALVGFESVKSFENDENFTLLIMKSADYRALLYNFKNPIFKDPSVRKALNLAVNKDLIVEKLLHNLGEVAHQPLQRFYPDNEKNEYDPKKASEILANLGYKKGKDGILQKDGKRLEFDAYAMSNDPLRVALVKFLASEFSKIGVKLNIFAKVAGSFDYSSVDSFLVGWGSPYDPDFHTFRVFESTQFEVWNFGHYKNKKVDYALNLARKSQNKRKEKYIEFINLLKDDPPFLFLVYLDFPLVFDKNIKGIKPQILGHHGVGFTSNAWEWSK